RPRLGPRRSRLRRIVQGSYGCFRSMGSSVVDPTVIGPMIRPMIGVIALNWYWTRTLMGQPTSRVGQFPGSGNETRTWLGSVGLRPSAVAWLAASMAAL